MVGERATIDRSVLRSPTHERETMAFSSTFLARWDSNGRKKRAGSGLLVIYPRELNEPAL